MAQRLRVLISAYACEPHKGSEPEVGWQWALQMARFHDVTVLTRANNRPIIEPELERLRGTRPLPRFIYHDRSPLLLDMKRRVRATKLYYLLWQRSAREVVARLHEVHQFDLMHHVTFAAFRYPVAIWGHGAPTIWGPIGGIESIPLRLLPWHHPDSLIYEMARNGSNVLQATPIHVLPRRARVSTLVLATTPEMQKVLKQMDVEAQLVPTIGLNPAELPAHRPRGASTGPLKLLFVGNIITLKGVDLALKALKESNTDATFTIVGSGAYLNAAVKLTTRLGLSERVRFVGRLPRADVLKLFSDFDAFIFPSLHDTGGYAVIEAMFNELPVICLDCGGPAVAVQENCGFKVPVDSPGRVVAGLAAAIRKYSDDRALLLAHGRNARARVLDYYDWDRKGGQMSECYTRAVAKHILAKAAQGNDRTYTGFGGFTAIAHGLLSLKGLGVSLIILVLLGAMGFASIGHLKTQARRIMDDTLPGLAYAGEARASHGQAFSRTLLLLVETNTARRKVLEDEIEYYNQETSRHLEAYSGAIFEARDRALFNQLLTNRASYVQIRREMIALIDQNRIPDASRICQAQLLPAYNVYVKSADLIFKYNMEQGQIRGRRIMGVCTVTQFVVAGAGVMIFILGFMAGFFR